MLEDYFKEEEEQQQEASAKVAITNSGQRNHPTALPSVFFSRPKKGCSVQVARCDIDLCVVPCFAEYHTNYIFIISPSLSILCVMIKQ